MRDTMLAELGRRVPRVELVLKKSNVAGGVVGAAPPTFRDIAGMFGWLADFPDETLLGVCLDGRNRVRHFGRLASGGITSVLVSPTTVLRMPLLTNSRGLILIHNHPDGDPRPSSQDLEFTREIRRACRAMRVCLHEHLVLGWAGFYCRICRQIDRGEERVERAERVPAEQ